MKVRIPEENRQLTVTSGEFEILKKTSLRTLEELEKCVSEVDIESFEVPESVFVKNGSDRKSLKCRKEK